MEVERVKVRRRVMVVRKCMVMMTKLLVDGWGSKEWLMAELVEGGMARD